MSFDDIPKITDRIGVDDKGNLICKLCGDILGEASIAKEDEPGLIAEIPLHYSMKHGIEIEAQPEL